MREDVLIIPSPCLLTKGEDAHHFIDTYSHSSIIPVRTTAEQLTFNQLV